MTKKELRALRKVLNTVDKALAKQDNVATALWWVLTGLRGPDNMDDAVKDKWTLPIRTNAFPLTAASGYEWRDGERGRAVQIVNGSVFAVPGTKLKFDEDGNRSHFLSHARSAVRALMELEEFNKEEL